MRVFTDERCLGHRVPPGFPEVPERLAGILAAFDADDRAEVVRGAGADRDTTLAAIAAVHPEGYIGRFGRAVARGDSLFDTADNPLSGATFEAASGAVAATLAALEAVVASPGAPCFAAVRPPGHHAERDGAMGFCFFNSVAVAARAAQGAGLGRVAIFDFDVHHGNGTQHIFEADPGVFYASVHQFPFYPGTGDVRACGAGPGEGHTVNVPFAAGANDGDYALVFRELLGPIAEQYQPDLVLVSAGFDAHRSDPLGGMQLTEEGFASLCAEVKAIADKYAGGRLVLVLEGGYDLNALAASVEAATAELVAAT